MAEQGPLVVGADPQPGSLAALREASRLAAAVGCGLIAARAVELPLDLGALEGFSVFPVNMHQLLGEEGEVELDRALKSAGVTANVERRVTLGSIASELHRIAQEQKAWLLVVGMNREAGERSIGVVASQCVRQAFIPVLVVEDGHAGEFRRMVACVDFSDVSPKVVQTAARWAQRDRAALALLHVHRPGRPPVVQNPVEDGPDVCANLRVHLEHFWNQYALPGVAPEFVVVEDVRADKAVNRYIASHRVDLAVLGTRGRFSVHDRILGTTAERMLRDAPVSLLAVPPAR